MANVARSFPLFGLPNNLVIATLKSMDFGSLVILPLVSNKMKHLIKSLDLTVVQFVVDFSSGAKISLNFDNDLFAWLSVNPVAATRFGDLGEMTPGRATVSIISEREESFLRFQWTSLNFGVRKLIDDYLYVFNRTEIKLTFQPTQFRMFRIETINEVLKGSNIQRFEVTDVNFYKQVFETFKNMKELEINPVFDIIVSEDIPELLIQNYNYFLVGVAIPVNLNNCLLLNSSYVEVENAHLTDRELNLFLKNWISGSYSRLEYLNFHLRNEDHEIITQISMEVLLKGIKHVIVPMDMEREFHLKTECRQYENRIIVFEGGIDITSLNGTKATILLLQHHTPLEMFVWN